MNAPEDNKLNVLYFESPSMRELHETIHSWQEAHRKRLQSVSIHKDGDIFCCIALTNPTEVYIVDGSGEIAILRNNSLAVHLVSDDD